jgi:hypothetical protein
MRSWLRSLLLGALVVAAIPFGGCSLTYFTISIPDFSSKQVGGVWLWRLSTTTGLYARDTQFVLSPIVSGPTGEIIDYSVVMGGGTPPQGMTTQVARDKNNPDKVVLTLLFTQLDAPGYYRASTFNAAGDSPLSSEIVPL